MAARLRKMAVWDRPSRTANGWPKHSLIYSFAPPTTEQSLKPDTSNLHRQLGSFPNPVSRSPPRRNTRRSPERSTATPEPETPYYGLGSGFASFFFLPLLLKELVRYLAATCCLTSTHDGIEATCCVREKLEDACKAKQASARVNKASSSHELFPLPP